MKRPKRSGTETITSPSLSPRSLLKSVAQRQERNWVQYGHQLLPDPTTHEPAGPNVSWGHEVTQMGTRYWVNDELRRTRQRPRFFLVKTIIFLFHLLYFFKWVLFVVGNTHVTCHVGVPSCRQRQRNRFIHLIIL